MTADRRIEAITKRIVERSKPTREAYLDRTRRAISKGVHRSTLSCGNLAHGFAVCSPRDKEALAGDVVPNLGIITAYNDMLSAHQPFETYPALIRQAASEAGGVAQVAGGVPAMCDGVTQGSRVWSCRSSHVTRLPWRRGSAFPTTCSMRPSISESATRSCQG